GSIAVVPATRIRLWVAAAADGRRRLVDVDAVDGRRGGGVAGIVDAGACVRKGLAAAFTAYGPASHGVGRNAGPNRARVRAAEGDGDVGVVPVVGVRLGAAATADC